MSNYNSKNTKVLATHDDNGNTRMLLMHEMDCGRREYVIGSYFTVDVELGDPYDREGPAFVDHYSWDWGHYFSDVVDAVRYWEREVLGVRDHDEEGAAL